ncbi:MAG: hypothetical protein V3R77_02925 [Candidatus Binatia bacterium]
MIGRSMVYRDLILARILTLGPVVLAFPVGTVAVFTLGFDRNRTADVIAWCYSIGLFSSFTTAFWPLAGLRGWSREDRVQSAVFLFLIVSYVTHLSWELGWLVLHERMAELKDVPWAYVWWAYIDGGDMRYANGPIELVTIEILSVINGLVGVTGLVLWFRTQGRDMRAVLLLMATAVVHLYSTSFYFLTEILAGLPNVDTSNFTDTWIKFGLANAPWLTMPWVVLWWGVGVLHRQTSD